MQLLNTTYCVCKLHHTIEKGIIFKSQDSSPYTKAQATEFVYIPVRYDAQGNKMTDLVASCAISSSVNHNHIKKKKPIYYILSRLIAIIFGSAVDTLYPKNYSK